MTPKWKDYRNPYKNLEFSQPAFTCSKLTTETLEQGEWRRSDIFIVKYFTPCSSASIVSFEIAIADWAIIKRI